MNKITQNNSYFPDQFSKISYKDSINFQPKQSKFSKFKSPEFELSSFLHRKFTFKNDSVAVKDDSLQSDDLSVESDQSRKSETIIREKQDFQQEKQEVKNKNHSDKKVTERIEFILYPPILKKYSTVEVEEDAYIFHQKKWIKTKFMLRKESLVFIEFNLQFDDIEKLKIMPGCANSRTDKILKIRANNRNNFISISYSRKHLGWPLIYYIFNKIIQWKVHIEGKKEQQERKQTSITCSQMIRDSYIDGKIYKKSQHLKEWNERYVVVRKEGIFSFKKGTQTNYSFQIDQSSIKYMWTRFQFHLNLLIIKIKHGIKKTEFAIPVHNGSPSMSWLFSFYRLIP